MSDELKVIVDAFEAWSDTQPNRLLSNVKAFSAGWRAHEAAPPAAPPVEQDAVEAARPDGLREAWEALWGRVRDGNLLVVEDLAVAILAADNAQGRSGVDRLVIQEIAAERKRQIEVEGWDADHDAEHDNGVLATAAACYALHAGASEDDRQINSGFSPPNWPWTGFWKPSNRRRDLIKAGALIVAEIERLDRVTKPSPDHDAGSLADGGRLLQHVWFPEKREQASEPPPPRPPEWTAERTPNLIKDSLAKMKSISDARNVLLRFLADRMLETSRNMSWTKMEIVEYQTIYDAAFAPAPTRDGEGGT